MKNKILVIVVTFNAGKWVDYCFGSIPKRENIDVICIDNDSRDNTKNILKEKYPEVQLLIQDENLGFGKANNIGLKLFLAKKEYSHVFLLNQDAKIEFDTIDLLVEKSLQFSEFGIFSPLHRSINNDQLEYLFSTYLVESITPGLISDLALGNNIKPIYSSDFVNAALWLLTRNAVESVGLFDPDFPHYGEDDDYLRRLRYKGLKLGVVPSAMGNHAREKPSERKIDSELASEYSKAYVQLLLKYKYMKGSSIKVSLKLFRDFIIALFTYSMCFDGTNIKVTCKSYFRIYKHIWLSN